MLTPSSQKTKEKNCKKQSHKIIKVEENNAKDQRTIQLSRHIFWDRGVDLIDAFCTNSCDSMK
jgi:hypothetical protein